MKPRISAPHVAAYIETPTDVEIAVIIPVYLGEPLVGELVARLHDTLQRIGGLYQIVLVDDRSPDNAWSLIKEEANKDPRVLGVRLSRNFGQHSAISAGIAHTKAGWYVVMDCDLQDPPEAIYDLHEAATQRGHDIVIAERSSSGLGTGRNFGSRIFNSMLRWTSGLDLSHKHGNFRIFSNRVAEAFRSFPERLRLFPAIMSQVGFTASTIVVSRSERPNGRSSYNIFKLTRLALETIIAYSEKPLWIMATIGSLVCALAFVYGLAMIAQVLVSGAAVPGFATLVVLALFFGGLQLFLTSLVGLYVGRALDEAKSRPTFIVEDTTESSRMEGGE